MTGAVAGGLALLGVWVCAAKAQTVCTAADVVGQDPGCPSGSGACSITGTFQVPSGCVLDFNSRAVTISGTLDIDSGSVTIIAGSLTIAPGGLIDGRGSQANPAVNAGGMITVQTSGAVSIQKSLTRGRIDVSSTLAGGTIAISAGGAVTIAGTVQADNVGAAAGNGGTIRIHSGGDITTLAGSIVTVKGGNTSLGGGGDIDFTAAGDVIVGDTIDITGSDAGTIEIAAGGQVMLGPILGNATGDAGAGGNIDVTAGTQAQVVGPVRANGSASLAGPGAGVGGVVSVEAQFGDLTITTAGTIFAEGVDPDGPGGEIDLLANGHVTLQAATPTTKVVSVRGGGPSGCGGLMCAQSRLPLVQAGLLDASGGIGGGEIDVTGDAAVTLNGTLDASGRALGASGGIVYVAAGDATSGALTITNTIDVRGGGCSAGTGCGIGGSTQLIGCALSVTSTGLVLAGAPAGTAAAAGENDLTARAQMTIAGKVNAAKAIASGSDGTNVFHYPQTQPPMTTGSVTPAAALLGQSTCTSSNQINCLIPCPTCGNGMVEFPEACDNNVGTAVSCDGCSAFCQIENCDDGRVCTTDSCDAALGCRNVPVPIACVEPPPGIDLLPAVGRAGGVACVAARLGTGGAAVANTTNDIGFSPSQFSFGGCSINPSIGLGTAANKQLTESSPLTGVGRVTVGGNTTLVPDGVLYTCPVSIAAGVAAGTYVLSNAPSAKDPFGATINGVTGAPGAVLVSSCSGDCDGSGQVSIGEVIRCANTFLGQPLCNLVVPSLSCPLADNDGSGGVSIGELLLCVNHFLSGCPAS